MSLPSLHRRFQSTLRFGWILILVAALGGTTLEALLAWKVPLYVDAASSTTRLMLRLFHAHAALLGLLCIAWALTAHVSGWIESVRIQWIDRFLRVSSILVPGGFLLGVWGSRGGDPGPGIALTPIGALLLVSGLILLVTKPRASE